MRSIHFLIFIPILLIACATTDLSKTFDEIAIEHYAMVHVSASELEWYELIAEFEKIIETDPTHEIADDAQWAIASCWMWLAERQGTVAFQRAAKNFRHLIDHYPNSIYLPQSHYFLGKCSEKLGDQNEAISQFQIVVEQFSDQPIAINAQNELDKFSSENSEANQPTEVSEKKPIEIADSEKPISNESEKSEIEITELDDRSPKKFRRRKW